MHVVAGRPLAAEIVNRGADKGAQRRSSDTGGLFLIYFLLFIYACVNGKEKKYIFLILGTV